MTTLLPPPRPGTIRGRPARALLPRAPLVGQSFTRRELDVLWLIADGLSNKQIADRLDISTQTAKFHVGRAARKLGTTSRTKAAVDFVLGRYSEAIDRIEPAAPGTEFARIRQAVRDERAQAKLRAAQGGTP